VPGFYASETLPIITADAQAPRRRAAAAIANAAVTELNLFLATSAMADKVPDAHRVVAQPLGSARSATVPGYTRSSTSDQQRAGLLTGDRVDEPIAPADATITAALGRARGRVRPHRNDAGRASARAPPAGSRVDRRLNGARSHSAPAVGENIV
jgi:hypothetical protein